MTKTDPNREVLKVWLEGDEPHFSLQPVFEDPAVWGLIFVDIARLLADAYSENGRPSEDTINRIRDAFIAELRHTNGVVEQKQAPHYCGCVGTTESKTL